MKEDITAIELHHLVLEVACLSGAKVDKIYQPQHGEIILQLHKTGLGKRLVRILAGKLLYLATMKGEQPTALPGYCAFLRKHLSNARLLGIEQLGSERIVAFRFDTKDGKRTLYVEFFTKGNAVLCDEHDVILSPLETKVWADRIIRKGEGYVYPKLKVDLFDLHKDAFVSVLVHTEHESIVKCLATEVGMGGIYAEEACRIATIEKTARPKNLSSGQIDLLFDAVSLIARKKASPRIVRRRDGTAMNIIPFEMSIYRDDPKLVQEPCETYHSAFDALLTPVLCAANVQGEVKAHQTKEQKAQNIIDAQQRQIKVMERITDDEQNKGELIYANFKLIEDILTQIRSARKTMSWNEIKERLKGHDMIKEIDEKTGKVTIEL